MPVCPTWCWWPIQPESTAEREAPTAARGKTAARSRRRAKALRALEPAAARDDDVGFGDVDLRALFPEDLGDPALDRAVGDGHVLPDDLAGRPRAASPSGKTFGRSVASRGRGLQRRSVRTALPA
ncbi:MAG: hypothetical protein MZU79_04955 [Anaerotruncus sp.]|nr:hypothetical protein [Anaerotruncus sp.]